MALVRRSSSNGLGRISWYWWIWYPAMAVVSHKKMKYSRLTGSFGHDGIREYLRDLSYGKGRTDTVKGAKLPKISKVEGWDGKDGELPEEEDIDLSDVDLDDKDEL